MDDFNHLQQELCYLWYLAKILDLQMMVDDLFRFGDDLKLFIGDFILLLKKNLSRAGQVIILKYIVFLIKILMDFH